VSRIGWRTWEISYHGMLTAVGWVSHSWIPGENVAVCMANSKHRGDDPTTRVPVLGCTCGFWAFKTPHRLTSQFWKKVDETDGMHRCVEPGLYREQAFGVVELAGKLVEHELGWHAEKARVLMVAVPPGRELHPSYRVPITRNFADVVDRWWDGVPPGRYDWARYEPKTPPTAKDTVPRKLGRITVTAAQPLIMTPSLIRSLTNYAGPQVTSKYAPPPPVPEILEEDW
jgi:hypothetical protein